MLVSHEADPGFVPGQRAEDGSALRKKKKERTAEMDYVLFLDGGQGSLSLACWMACNWSSGFEITFTVSLPLSLSLLLLVCVETHNNWSQPTLFWRNLQLPLYR